MKHSHRFVAPNEPLLIDFDGVLHDSKNVLAGRRMGQPIPGAIESVCKLFDKGHEIVIFTARATSPKTTEAVANWLGYFGIPYHRITNVKPSGSLALIDDRAIRFTNWSEVMEEICS